DRIPVDHPYRYLTEKFQVGLPFPGDQSRRLDRIVGLASTGNGASNSASIADVIIGAFRYCMNEPDKDIAGGAILPQIVNLMWKKDMVINLGPTATNVCVPLCVRYGVLNHVDQDCMLVENLRCEAGLGWPGDSMHFHDEIRVISCFFAEAVVRND